MSSTAVLGFVDAADAGIDSFHSFMLVRHGNVVAEGWWSPYAAESRHELYSLSKSFTSTAVGMAIAEGKMTISDSVLSYFTNDAPAEVSENLKNMRLRDLLRMSAGHQKEVSTAPDVISAKTFLTNAVPFKPGTHFLYNTPATFMASAMVTKATGESVLDFLKPRLFEPLGIVGPTWGTNFQGISLGGYGLSVRTEDIAKLGQLYLQKGKWKGKQLIPAGWVDEATALQTSNGSNPKSDWDQGYGYQFWRCRNGAFRGDGAYGQYCIVMPEQEAVVVITSGVRDMQAVMNLVWDKLLPAMEPQKLSSDPVNARKLAARLQGLSIHKPEGAAESPILKKVAGTKYVFAENDKKLESVMIEAGSAGKGATVVIKKDGLEQRVECGMGEWKKGRFVTVKKINQPSAACGAWASEDTYVVKMALYETPFIAGLKLRFADDQLFYDSEMNVGGGKDPQLVGKKQ